MTVIPFVLLSVIGAALYMVQPIYLGAVADTLGFSDAEIGYLAGAELVAVGLSALLALYWIRRVVIVKALIVTMTITILGTVLSVFTETPGQLVAVRFVTAVAGIGPLYSIAIAGLSWSSNPERSFSYSVIAQVLFSIIALAGLPLLVESHGLDAIFISYVLLCLLALPTIWFLLNYVPPPVQSLKALSWRDAGAPLSALLIQVIWFIAIGAVWAYVERIGVASGISSLEVGQILAVSLILSLSGAFAASLLAGKSKSMMMFSIVLIGHISVFGFLTGEQSFWVFALLVLLFNTFWNFGTPFLLGEIAISDATGRLSVLIPAAQAFGLAIGPLLCAQYVDETGLDIAPMIGIFACLACLTIVIIRSRLVEVVVKP